MYSLQHQIQQESDPKIKIETTKNTLSFLQNRNFSISDKNTTQQYININQNGQQKNSILNSYEQVCGKQVGIYDRKQGVDKPNIKPQSLNWFGDGNHCLLAYHQQGNPNQKNFRFDLHLINSQTQTKVKWFPARQGIVQGIGGLCMMKNQKNILLGDKAGELYILEYGIDYMGNQQQQLYQKKSMKTTLKWINQVSTSPEDRKVALGGEDNSVHIYDIETNQTDDPGMEGHGQKLNHIEWHPYLALIMSCSDDKQINVWCPQQKERLFQMYHNLPVNKAIWHQNGNWILSCGKDQVIKLYDIRNHQKEMQVFRCSSEVKTISWHPSNPSMFLSAQQDGSFTQWHVNSTTYLDKNTNIQSPICDIKYNPFGNIIAAFTEDKELMFFGKGKSDNTILQPQQEPEDPQQQQQQQNQYGGGLRRFK